MTSGISRARLGALACVLLGLFPIQAASQGSEGTLEEITVTARRVAENLQDTPIAVTAFTGDALENRQVFRTSELDQVVPNLQFADNAPLAGNNSSSQVFIRGIGQTDPTSTVDPGVGLYIDDVYIGNAVGGTMGLRDLASIQVLRGPQARCSGATPSAERSSSPLPSPAMSWAARCAAASAPTVCSTDSRHSMRRSPKT
jgi:outer membrane receptor protein involved in Fe transport